MQSIDSVVLITDAPSARPLVDLLSLLSHQRLLRPLAVAVGDGELQAIEDGVRRNVDLADILQQSVDQFRLLHLALADGTSSAARSIASAVDMERTIRNALAVRDGSELQTLTAMNVVAPAPLAESMPKNLYVEGDLGKWVNVVLMPEDQQRSDLAVVEVALDQDYVAHVGCALATVGGLWFGDQIDPGLLKPNAEPPCWHLARTRSRTLSATEVPDIVIGQVARGGNPLPSESGRRFDSLSADDTGHLIDASYEAIVDQHHLAAQHPAPPAPPSARRIGLRQLLGLIKDFLTFGLGRRLRSEIQARQRELVTFVENRLNTVVGTDGLDFTIGLGSAVSTNGQLSDPRETAQLSSGSVAAEPALWEQLRTTAFGLLDGGPLPAGPEAMVSLGSTRLVVSERSSIASRTIGHSGDPSTAEDVPRPFVDRICWRLDRETNAAQEVVDDIEKRLSDLRAKYVEDQERANRPWWRRAATWAWRGLKILFVVALAIAIVMVVPILLPFAGALLAVWFIVAGAALLFGALAVVARMCWRWFREAHALRDGPPEIVFLSKALAVAKVQLSRFESITKTSREWLRVIQVMVHEPFGPPIINDRPRVRNAELHLPHAHAIQEAAMSDLRREGVCVAVRRSVYRTGWLTKLYQQAADLARREYQLRQPGQTFDPDGDRTNAASDVAGPRRTLRSAVVHGRARAEGRIRLAIEVHNMLATGHGVAVDGPVEDWLFSDLHDDQLPSEFLAETFVGEPALWNRSSVITNAGAARPSDDVERLREDGNQDQVLPEVPDVEDLLAGATVEFRPFLFRSQCIEVALDVPQSHLVFFTDEPKPAVVDVSAASTLWQIPDQVDRGDVERIDESERAGWGILEQDLPEIGRRVRPLAPPARPIVTGPFTFIVEVDGVPARLGVDVMPFRIRCASAPPNGVQIALHCLQLTSDATGVSFEFAGKADGLPNPADEFEGLDIAWAFDDEYREYERRCGQQPGSSIGLGGPRTRPAADGSVHILGGTAVLNAEMAATTELAGRISHAMVLLHELGHALNLGHVNALNEVMYSSAYSDGLETWGAGDRLGLLTVASARSMVSV